jgi:MFS-type transporter involved in bile tolerance (Atg22 family)
MPTYIHEFRQVGTLASVNLILGGILVVSGLVATITGGILADALRNKVKGAYFSVSGWALYVAAPCCVAFIYLPFPVAWGLLFAACFCLFLNTGPSNTALANTVRPEHRPAAFALNILIIHLLGDVPSPLAIGSITDSTGSMNNAMLMLAAMVWLGGFIWRLGAKHLDEDTARVSNAN